TSARKRRLTGPLEPVYNVRVRRRQPGCGRPKNTGGCSRSRRRNSAAKGNIMARKISRGEGADGFFLKTLTECIGRLGAIDHAKAQVLREHYHSELFKNQLAVENPKEYMRHEGA